MHHKGLGREHPIAFQALDTRVIRGKVELRCKQPLALAQALMLYFKGTASLFQLGQGVLTREETATLGESARAQ